MDRQTTAEAADAWHMTDDLHAETGMGDPFAAAMRATRMSMIITDPRRTDNPIVFANNAFLKLTGYARQEVVGRNCRFLQGEETDPASVRKIREAIEARSDLSIDILNYRRDGSSFWNALYISPVSNQAGELQFYFASQLDVTDRKTTEQVTQAEKDKIQRAVEERTAELRAALEAKTTVLHEVDHRVKNNLQMVSSLILMQSRSIKDPAISASLRAMLERIEALSTVHRRLYQSDDVSRFDVSDFVRDLVTDVVGASGRDNIRTRLELEPIEIPAAKAAPVALMINELVTNALKHAFADNRAGTIGVRVTRQGRQFDIEVSDDGVGMDASADKGSFGMKLVKSLARQLRAEAEWTDANPGTRIIIRMPAELLEKGV